MKQKIFLTTILLLAMVAVSGCFNKETTENPEPNNEQEQTQSLSEFSGTLEDLMKEGQAVKCSYDFEDDGSIMHGLVYTDGQNSRTETRLSFDGETPQEAYSIMDEQWIYSWNSMMPGQGTKMDYKKLAEETKDLPQPETSTEPMEPAEQMLDYHCEAWDVDEAMFDLPENIVFTEFKNPLPSVNTPNLGGVETQGMTQEELEALLDQIKGSAE